MTSRQQLRLDLAERVCRLVTRHRCCGLNEAEGYEPDVVSALHFAQAQQERIGGLARGSLHWLGEHGENIRSALFAWMEACGVDPVAQDKAETKLTAMELAKDALGSEYEGEARQLPSAKRVWVERTADERAASVAQEFLSGKIRGFDELRIAIAGEILEAEHIARDPFVQFAREMFDTVVSKQSKEEDEKRMGEAAKGLLMAAWRWMGINPPRGGRGSERSGRRGDGGKCLILFACVRAETTYQRSAFLLCEVCKTFIRGFDSPPRLQ